MGLHINFQMDTPETPSINPEITKDFEPWGDVTDPKTHDPTKFRYLVHGINPMASSSMPILGAMVAKDDPSAINPTEGDQTINLFSQPERLDQRVALSCSLVDQDHHETWGKVGLIVEAPPENVAITHPQDVGAILMSKRHLLEQAQLNQLLTADELLQQSCPSTYNEVVVLANNEGKKVALAGFFYKVTDDGTPMDQALYNRMRKHAQRLNAPLIPITQKRDN